MCVLFDRGGKVTVNGQPKKEKADMKIVPKLLDLVSSLRVTLQVIVILIRFFFVCDIGVCNASIMLHEFIHLFLLQKI